MTFEKFCREYSKRGSQILEEVALLYEKKCHGWIYKRMRTFGKIEKHHTQHEIQNMVLEVFHNALIILFDLAVHNELYASKTQVSTLIIKICENLLYKKEAPIEQLSEYYSSTLVTDEVYNEELYGPHQLALLKSCLEKLAPKQRELLRLHIEKVLQVEIAAILGYRDADAVKSMLYKVKSFLKTCLKDFFK